MMNTTIEQTNIATGCPMGLQTRDGDMVQRQSTQYGVQRSAVEIKRNLWSSGNLLDSKPEHLLREPSTSSPDAWRSGSETRNLHELRVTNSNRRLPLELLEDHQSSSLVSPQKTLQTHRTNSNPTDSDHYLRTDFSKESQNDSDNGNLWEMNTNPLITQEQGTPTPNNSHKPKQTPIPPLSNHNDWPKPSPPPPTPPPSSEGTNSSRSNSPTPPYESPDEINNQQKKRIDKVGRKQGIKIASLNIHGKTYTTNGSSKYKDIFTLVRRNKIAVLALQETRLNEEETNRINRENKQLTIINSGNSTAKDGVAFVLNNELLLNAKWEHHELVIGQAHILQLTWLEGNTIDITNIHAPNITKDKTDFFKTLQEKMKKKVTTKQTILLGDFNFVEEAIDRLPQHTDNDHVVNAFTIIKNKYELIDGWRWQNPDLQDYTYIQPSTNSMSRIDRIYANKNLYKKAYNWGIIENAAISDHKIPTMEILRENQPYTGEGYWRLPISLIDHPTFHNKSKKLIKETQEKIANSNNPQEVWKEFKLQIKKVSQETSKLRNKQLKQQRQNLHKHKRTLIKQVTEAPQNARKKLQEKIHLIENTLSLLDRERISKIQATSKANFQSKGERCTKYWFNLNKKKQAIDPILSLFDKHDKLQTTTQKMTEIASGYHENLQKEQESTVERDDATTKILTHLTTKLNEDQKTMFEEDVTYSELRKSLKACQNSKAPGIDGIPYEFYKKWTEYNDDDDDEINILSILQTVYKDIEENGVKNHDWTRGVMCLLYKKKDKRRIENYRPITLVNTDYKIFTKAIATRLGKVAPHLIHNNQNGFIPGRGLYDATRTSQMVLEYCEQFEINGCVISLDQEKAYDKIAHDYLWKVLEKLEFPKHFIDMIKSIYGNAKTIIMVNGVLPEPINVARGVRQGDPMSCLLYNLAIEPLAAAIRNSKLKGISIPEIEEKILVSLFADDTLIYFNAEDDLTELNKIITEFCTASTAKFNAEKTEYLPMGTPKFRKTITETRQIGINPNNKIDPNLTIIPEKGAMRTLGAWIGNGHNTYPQWNSILEKQKQIIEVWSSTRPSLTGRILIMKALLQSRALFLATVNGMPEDILKKMSKQLQKFLWSDKKGYINWNTTIQDRSQGGLQAPDLKSRLIAIQVMWLKRFLSPKNKRPNWAYLADKIIHKNITKKPIVDEASKQNWILQSWHESETKTNTIPPMIKLMLKTGRKLGIGIDALKYSQRTKNLIPIWHHPAIKNNYYWNKKSSRCLRETHNITTVGDIDDIITERRELTNCETLDKCTKILHTIATLLPNKFNPSSRIPHRDNLDHSPNRLKKYKDADLSKETVAFNPDITEYEDPETSVRLFIKKATYKTRQNKETNLLREPANRTQNNSINQGTIDPLVIYTDGSSTKNGSLNSTAGSGIYVPSNETLSKAIRITGPQTNQRAELIAVLEAIRINKNHNIEIRTDSRYCIDGILLHAKKNEDANWMDISNADVWKAVISTLRQRTSTTTFKWIKGHSGEPGNEAADKLAAEGAEKQDPDHINLKTNPRFRIKGARLSSLTQKQAYRMTIKKLTKFGLTYNTSSSLEDIQDEIERITDKRPTKDTIWKNIWKTHIPNPIKDFLWKWNHCRIRCGTYFTNIEQLQDRQFCQCGEIETPGHILLHCPNNNQNQLWQTIEKIWKEEYNDGWLQPTEGLLKGLSSVHIQKDNKTNKPKTEAYHTLVSEAIWTIWKARNNRIFNETTTNADTLISQWKTAIRNNLTTEYQIIQQIPYRDQDKATKHFKNKWCQNRTIIALEQQTITFKI